MRVCAYGEVLSGRENCLNKSEERGRLHKESELMSTLTTVETAFARQQFPEARTVEHVPLPQVFEATVEVCLA